MRPNSLRAATTAAAPARWPAGPRFIEPERRPGRCQSLHDALDPSGGGL